MNGERSPVHARSTVQPITEAQFLRQVQDLSKMFGWSSYHPALSKWSERGWPDLALCRPPRLILAELKSAKGTVSVWQSHWLGILGQCPGVEVYLWRPADLERIAEVLR